MGFVLGFLMGLLAAFGLFGFLAYWVCTRSNTVAVAKYIDGIAQASARGPREPFSPNKDDKATERR
jgi:hypothetical protein